VPAFDPNLLARWTGGRWVGVPARGPAGFSVDTRSLRAGEVFVALRTGRRDGHDFLADAAAAGAAAAIVSAERPGTGLAQLVVPDPLAAFQAIARAHRRAFAGPVVGVTGSAGKTSTKDLLALLLGEGTLATEGNLNNHIGVPLTLTRLDPAVHTNAVIEAGISAPGDMAVLAGMIEPDAAIVTLVAEAHLEELGGLAGVAREKALLPASVKPGGFAAFPASCAAHAPFRDLRGRVFVVDPSLERRGESIHIVLAGFEDGGFELRGTSEGMARNAALALTAASLLGVAPALLRRRLALWRPAPLRGEVRRQGGRLLYVDCYNANPASMADALRAFEALAPRGGPRLFVIGCMEELGAEAARLHRELGRSLHPGPADLIFVTGGHAPEVVAGALEGDGDPERIRVAESMGQVAERLAAFRGAVFIKGSRLHRLEQILEAQTCSAT
jgi:UDP-N-acetylmuramoyl-tripeptide--D-alanyl-D-alanine ligase